jgi:hypothetical protein
VLSYQQCSSLLKLNKELRSSEVCVVPGCSRQVYIWASEEYCYWHLTDIELEAMFELQKTWKFEHILWR